MKKLKTILIAAAAAVCLTACNDYLDINPENSLPTENMWSSKKDVESALFAGYYNLRSSIEDNLIPLGELRAGCVKRRSGGSLDKLEIKATDKFTDWKIFYKVIADANGVLANAEKARGNDATYTMQEMNSHLCEAYFLRALSYFYIVRNWRDAPLITTPYESDEFEYNVPKSGEAQIISQIKSDLSTAIKLGAAKEEFDTTWETKGRATLWALYALMSDVCLYNSDFDDAVKYADMILESKSPYAPRFMATPSHSSWFKIFNPGNSDESIFELQFSSTKLNGTSYQTNNLPVLFYTDFQTTTYMLSENLVRKFQSDANDIATRFFGDQDMYVRTKFGGYTAAENDTRGFVWKYIGGTTITEPRTTNYYDPNFIIYRVTEIMLIKAEALLMRHTGTNIEDNSAAIDIINQVRHRTNLLDARIMPSSEFTDIMNAIINERVMEFVAEGKAWYDFMRIGRYNDPTGAINFANEFLINNVVEYNTTAGENKVKSTLLDKNAWYLPVFADELTHNPKLTQNPYYK